MRNTLGALPTARSSGPHGATVAMAMIPSFSPTGTSGTFGEMTAEEKHGWKPGEDHALSHRAKAIKAFAEAMLK